MFRQRVHDPRSTIIGRIARPYQVPLLPVNRSQQRFGRRGILVILAQIQHEQTIPIIAEISYHQCVVAKDCAVEAPAIL